MRRIILHRANQRCLIRLPVRKSVATPHARRGDRQRGARRSRSCARNRAVDQNCAKLTHTGSKRLQTEQKRPDSFPFRSKPPVTGARAEGAFERSRCGARRAGSRSERKVKFLKFSFAVISSTCAKRGPRCARRRCRASLYDGHVCNITARSTGHFGEDFSFQNTARAVVAYAVTRRRLGIGQRKDLLRQVHGRCPGVPWPARGGGCWVWGWRACSGRRLVSSGRYLRRRQR